MSRKSKKTSALNKAAHFTGNNGGYGPGVSTNLDPAVVLNQQPSQGPAQAGSPFHVSGAKPDAWFGPFQPLNPIAQDKSHGRQFDYPVGYNTRVQPKDDINSTITFEQLRGLADNLDVLRLAIETRKDQVESFEWEIIEKSGQKASGADIKRVKDFFRRPTPEHDFSTWLRIILEDIFVTDAVAIYPVMTRGGDLYALEIIDGTTIKRVIDDGGRTPQAPDPAYQQILKGVPATDYTSDELMYIVRNMRSNKLYGFSPVEQIIMTINIALRRQLVQLQHYTEGNIPEALMSVPDTWNPDQIDQFQRWFDDKLNDPAQRSRAHFVPVDVSKMKETRSNAGIKDVFDEWLARVVCFAFSISPAPFVANMNRATAESAADMAQEEGLKPLLKFLSRLMNRIIEEKMELDTVEFQWSVKSSTSGIDQANIDKTYIDAGVKDADEVRDELGLGERAEPVEPPTVPGVPPIVPPVPGGTAAPAPADPNLAEAMKMLKSAFEMINEQQKTTNALVRKLDMGY